MGEEPDTGQIEPPQVEIAAAEELVATANGENGRAACHRRFHSSGLSRQIACDERLLTILATADVEQIVRTGSHLVVETDRLDCELVPSERRAPIEYGDVASVGVDVEIVGIQVSNPNSHALDSQKGLVRPRPATIRCSASIAV